MSVSRPERLIGVIVALVLAAFAIAVIGLLVGNDETPPTRTSDGSLPTGMARAEVVHVSDGDTVVVSIDGREERVRYVGLDTPEIAHPEDGIPAECWGDEARAANAELVDGKTVALERDASDRDRFGRLLRHVWVSDAGTWTLVGERLIRDGNAEARTYPPDTTRDGLFAEAEAIARDASLGLWSGC